MTNRYEIRGDHAAIFLQLIDGHQYETLISIGDLEKVKQFRGTWSVAWTGLDDPYCVGSPGTVYLHRYILNPPEDRVVDHKHQKTLDNRRSEIRIVSYAVNRSNRKANGWVYPLQAGQWRAVSTVDQLPKMLGRFSSKDLAVAALEREARIKSIRQAHARLRAKKAGMAF